MTRRKWTSSIGDSVSEARTAVPIIVILGVVITLGVVAAFYFGGRVILDSPNQTVYGRPPSK